MEACFLPRDKKVIVTFYLTIQTFFLAFPTCNLLAANLSTRNPDRKSQKIANYKNNNNNKKEKQQQKTIIFFILNFVVKNESRIVRQTLRF